MIRQESWILDHFEIFVTIALKRAYGNRWQSEDGDATWRTALPWRRYLRATTVYLIYSMLNLCAIMMMIISLILKTFMLILIC